jgi:putative hemolysin
MPPEIVPVASGILLILAVASAFFSGMETALFSITDLHLRRWREWDAKTAVEFQDLMTKPRKVLSVILLTDTLINIPLIVLLLAWVNSVTTPVPAWAETLILFAVIVLVCDLLPKMLALADPFRFSKSAIRILRFLLPVLAPVSNSLERVAERAADLLPKIKSEAQSHLADDELITMIDWSAERGELRDDEREMIQEIIKLGNKTVGDCMTPRVDAFTIPDTLENDEAIRELRIKRYGRVPVYGESPDEILGVLDVKRFLMNPAEHYTEHLDPPSLVPETMRALDLLRAFLTHPQRLAIVVDEFGGTEGLITFNDIVEEIIEDAAPRRDDELYIETMEDGRVLASGAARLDDLSEALEVEIVHEGIDTIGGLIFTRLGYLPKAGTRVDIPPLELEVRQSSRKRILEVMVNRPSRKEETIPE